ncbi:ROK family protein [Ethanoligenens harbinense YUAN-3]|uniref:ROK family protein n=2 Tax=Ethanoligenens harbinense TaxID=253239 RepID=E6U6B4_ETHHY|nr:ROK family protein [Ethanoligenens harbinense YUAN-3]
MLMYQIGVDLGGTNIAIGLVDDEKKLILKDSVPTALPRSAQAIADDIAALTRSLVERAGLALSEARWLGLGTPGTANAETGIIEYANNLGFENVPIRDMLGQALGLPVYIENDANAAAYGEYVAGAAHGGASAVVITLGTGVGSGVIIDGQIYHGINYAGGEFGHVVIRVDGRPCTCGRHGCWEAYSSATGLIKSTVEAMEADKSSVMWALVGNDLSKVNGKTAFDGKRAGDDTATRVVDAYLRDLGQGLVNVINIFQPDVLCIGGGICKEGDGIIKPLEEIIRAERYSKFANKQTALRTAKLGNDAGIIGAAMIGSLYTE